MSSSANTNIPSSTVSAEISEAILAVTSEFSETEEATSCVTTSSETITSMGSTMLVTLLASSGSVSEGFLLLKLALNVVVCWSHLVKQKPPALLLILLLLIP